MDSCTLLNAAKACGQKHGHSVIVQVREELQETTSGRHSDKSDIKKNPPDYIFVHPAVWVVFLIKRSHFYTTPEWAAMSDAFR